LITTENQENQEQRQAQSLENEQHSVAMALANPTLGIPSITLPPLSFTFFSPEFR
jgi:hypothetical protein